MAMALEHLTREALELPVHQRLTLAAFLLDTDQADDGVETDEIWDREIMARINQIDEGTAASVPYTDVMIAADRLLAE